MIGVTRTLLQIAGAPLHPSPLDRSALVVIDPQLEYVDGLLPLEGIEEAILEISRLIEIARDRDVPIFHVVHHGPSGAAAFDPDGPGVGIVEELTPRNGESIVVKSLPNAFAATNFHDLLQKTGRTELIIAGFATHMCVSTTARAAIDHGYRVTIVANATATRDLPSPIDGRTIRALAVHEITLAALADRFAIVVPNAAALITIL